MEMRKQTDIPVASSCTHDKNDPAVLSDRLEQAIPNMAHEAIVNAAKHAQPSWISVDVRDSTASGSRVGIAVPTSQNQL